MRTCILDVRRKPHRASLDERSAFDVHIVVRKLGPYAGVERHLARLVPADVLFGVSAAAATMPSCFSVERQTNDKRNVVLTGARACYMMHETVVNARSRVRSSTTASEGGWNIRGARAALPDQGRATDEVLLEIIPPLQCI